MRSTRREFLKGAAAGLAAAGLGVRARPAMAQAAPVKIGTAVLGDYALAAPVFIGIEKGFFKANGLNAEFIPFRGGPDLLKGVVAGEVLLGISGSTDVLVFREAGTMIRAIATTTGGNHFTLNVAPGIAKVADLRGKTIGVTRIGATTWVFARMLAKREGWDPERDVKIVALGGMDAQLAALARGEAQAFVWGDGGAVIEVQGKGKILLRLDEVTPRWISQLAYATEEAIQDKADLIRRSLQGIFQAIKFMKANPGEAARIGAKHLRWPEEAVRLAHKISGPLLPADGQIDVEALRIMQDTLLEQGVIKTRLPLEDHYTTAFTPVKV